LIKKVLQNPSYREQADYFQKVISRTRGLDVAADIIEQAFKKYETDNMANKDFQLSHHG
jgi:zeaxanthin glucosyltransferase